MSLTWIATVAAIASAIAAISSALVALASPAARRFWQLLRKWCPKSQLIKVIALMSRMENVEASHSIWKYHSTMTLKLLKEDEARTTDVFLVAKHPWAILAITQAFEDHDWELEFRRLRTKFRPKETHDEGT